jgi:hypothetical protein
MNLNKDEWQIGFDDGSGKGKNSGLNEGIFIRVKGGGGGTPSIVTGDTDDYGIPIGIRDPAVANVIVMVPQMYRACKALLDLAQQAHADGMYMNKEWATVVEEAKSIVTEIDRNMTE